MTQRNPLAQSFYSSVFFYRALTGAAIAFILMAVFIYGVDNPNPEWGAYWMIRPLVVISLAGACGGAFYHFMDQQRLHGWPKLFAVLFSLLVYVIGIWLGSVIGLDGTLWN